MIWFILGFVVMSPLPVLLFLAGLAFAKGRFPAFWPGHVVPVRRVRSYRKVRRRRLPTRGTMQAANSNKRRGRTAA